MKIKLYLSSLLCAFIFTLNSLNAQITITGDSVNCGATGTTLRAVLVGEDSSTTGITTDDYYSGVIPIGFTFNFYGTNHTKLIIGGNGTLRFDTTYAFGAHEWEIDSPLLRCSKAYSSICGPWCDVDIRFGGTITYSTIGSAPNRRFIATWCRSAMYYCNYQYLNTQIILYEGTNNIEVHLGHKDTCNDWNAPGTPYAIIGVQNRNGTSATAAPGRDYPTVWTADREAWRFVQNSAGTSYTVSSITYGPVPFSYSTIHWYDGVTNAYLGSGSSIYVTPPGGARTYYAMAAGCGDSTITYYNADLAEHVVSSDAITAEFDADLRPGCFGDTVVLTNKSYPTGYTSSWDFGDGISESATNTSHVYAAQGTYTVVLTYSDLTGCRDTASKVVNFNHTITPGFTVNPIEGCAGAPVNFTNTSVAGRPTYVWSFGDGFESNDTDPAHTYNLGGQYIVRLTVIDSLNCSASTTSTLNVVSVKAYASFADTIVCIKDSINFLAWVKVEPSTYTNLSYQWAPSINLSNDTITNPKFSGLGVYYYDFIATLAPFGCRTSVRLKIESQPPLQLSNVTPSQTIPYGSSVQLNASGAYIYVWSPNDGTLNDPNINNPIATPTDSVTNYQVIAMSKYGCKDTAYVNIRTIQDTAFVMPSAFTPNGDGKNDVFRPFNLKFFKLMDFRVFNRWGKEVYHQSTGSDAGWDGTFNGEKLDLGVYFYTLVLANPDGTQRTLSGDVTLIR